MAKREIELKIKSDTTALKDTRQRLKELKSELLSIDDVDVFAEKAAEAAELEDSLNRVNGQVKLLSGSGSAMTNFSSALGSIGRNLLSLDFDAAVESSKALAIVSKQIDFKMAIGSLKSLGQTFITVGKAILTNPLFLLAAIIVAVVYAIYKLLDSLGVIKVAMEVLGKAIDWVVGLFKSLTDWLGITNNASVDVANTTAEEWEKTATAMENSSSRTISALDHQIRMMKLEGADTEDLERTKRKEIQETARVRMMADLARAQAASINSELSDEEKREARDKANASRDAYMQIVRDTQYFEAEIAKAKEDATKKAAEEAQQQANKEQQDRVNTYKEAQRLQKEYADNRLNVARTTRDVELEMMVDGIDKEVAIQNEKYKRLIEDTKNNTKMLEDEKTKLIEYYTKLQQETETKLIRDNEELKNNALIEARKDYDNMMMSLNQNSFEQQISQIDKSYTEQKDKFQEMLDNKIISQEEYNQALIDLDIDRRNKLAELDTYQAEELNPIQKAQVEAEQLLEIERAKLEAGLITKEEMAEREKQIYANLEKEKRRLDAETNKEAVDKFIAKTNEIGQVAQQGIGAINDLVQASYAMEIKNAEGNEKKQEQLRKKAFEANKKAQIANAVISMAMGIVNAFSAPFPMSLVMAAIAAATGIASIIKIKSTSYQGGSSPMSAPSASSVSAPSLNSSDNFRESGMSTATNNQSDTPSNESTRVYILQSDIEDSNNESSNMRMKGEIA